MKRFAVFATKKIKGGSTMFRVGSATQNRDGSINVYLDCLPLDGVLHMREPVGTEALSPPAFHEPDDRDDIPRCTERVPNGRHQSEARCALSRDHRGDHMTVEQVRQAREIAGQKSTSGELVLDPCNEPVPGSHPCLRPRGHDGAHGGY